MRGLLVSNRTNREVCRESSCPNQQVALIIIGLPPFLVLPGGQAKRLLTTYCIYCTTVYMLYSYTYANSYYTTKCWKDLEGRLLELSQPHMRALLNEFLNTLSAYSGNSAGYLGHTQTRISSRTRFLYIHMHTSTHSSFSINNRPTEMCSRPSIVSIVKPPRY